MFLCSEGRNVLSPISNLCSDEEAHGKPWQLIYLFCETRSGDRKKNGNLCCSWGGSLIVFYNLAVSSGLQEAVS